MAWKPPENKSDIERLQKLLAHFETVNLDQIQQIERLNQTYDANAKRILELEKNRVALNKTIKSLEGRMKFDKIASDGIKKKFNLLEVEVRDLKYSNDHYLTERTENVAKIAQLEDDLNKNRSDKLKFMHENAKLLKENAELRGRETDASSDAVFARKDLLQKLEMLDDLIQTNETYKHTIDAQSQEMLMSTHKQYDINEKLTETRRHVVSLEAMTAEYNHTIDILQHEISRLRKELMDASSGVSGQSAAVLSRTGASNRSNRIGTDIITRSYAYDGEDGAYALSRRPRTEQGISRERNRYTAGIGSDQEYSHSLTEGSASASFSMLPSLSETSARTTTAATGTRNKRSRACSRAATVGGGREAGGTAAVYEYRDTTQYLARTAQSAPVVVDGGRISLDSSGVQRTVRAHILQGYDQVMPTTLSASQEGRASTAASSSRHPLRGQQAGHSASQPNLFSASLDSSFPTMDPSQFSTATSFAGSSRGSCADWAGEAMSPAAVKPVFSACRPFSTPFRPKSDTMKPVTLGGVPASPGSSSCKMTRMQESVAQLQDCYSNTTTEGKHIQSKNNKNIHSLKSPNSVLNKSNNHNSDILKTRSLSPSQQNPPEGELHVTFHPSQEIQEISQTLHSTELQDTGLNTKSGKKSNKKGQESGKKSIFVGSGLGFKPNTALEAELNNLNKGSTQQILRKILGDRFD